MNTLEKNKEVAEARYETLSAEMIKEARERRTQAHVTVGEFWLEQTAGPKKLSDCFEGRRDLIVVYNMGIHCSYCTMWADGINGVQAHLRDRAGLILVSGDPAEQIEKTARERGWKFPVASDGQSGFFAALGMGDKDSPEPWPGMSTFHLNDEGEIEHITTESFGPFDQFSPVWHFLGRLKDGVNQWEPKNSYE